MEVFVKLLFFTSLLLGYVWTDGVLPVQKCKLDDSECLKSSFQSAITTFVNGVPDLGVDVLDPLQLDDIAFDLLGLQFTFKEGIMKGLKSTIIDEIKWDVEKEKIHLKYHMNASSKGHYTAAGRLLVLPISGDGDLKMKLKNLIIAMHIDYEMEKGEDGKEYVKPTNLEFEFDVKDNAHFTMTNLFNGNKALSDTMHTFMNSNWQQVCKEFGKPLMQASASKVFDNIKTYFSKQALEDIAIV